MKTLLLQLSDTLSNPVSSVTGSQDEVSLLELTFKGGWLMIPIVILSLIACYIFIERLLVLKKSSVNPETFMANIKDMVVKGNIEGAKRFCSETDTPIARMIGKGITKLGNPLKVIDAAIENEAKLELFILEKYLATLAGISGAAPMLGFLGTVTGMIQAFIAISHNEGNVSPALLANGIYEAMITTAAGLIVGIPAYIAYNYLVSRVNNIVHQMERRSVEFIDLLQEPK